MKHNRLIAFQRQEIQQLASDPGYRAKYASTDHYSRVGAWPGAVSGARVLELGCGPGRYAALLSAMGCRVVAVDPHQFETWSLVRRHSDVQFMPDVYGEALPFKDAAFDAVSCLGALLYFADAGAALAEISRVLRPNGHLILRTVNRDNLFRMIRRRNIDPATRQVYTMPELVSLLEASGFVVTSRFAYGVYSPVAPAAWWRLMNGPLSIEVQSRLSRWLPEAYRTNLVVFAQRGS